MTLKREQKESPPTDWSAVTRVLRIKYGVLVRDGRCRCGDGVGFTRNDPVGIELERGIAVDDRSSGRQGVAAKKCDRHAGDRITGPGGVAERAG